MLYNFARHHTAVTWHSFTEVIRQGETEGLTFDKNNNKFLLLHNRGARIDLGMPKGLYDDYTREIHEVFIYDIMPVDQP